MKNGIDFEAIRRSLDRQIFVESLVKNIVLWIVAIVLITLYIGILLGYISVPPRCRYNERLGDYECWNRD